MHAHTYMRAHTHRAKDVCRLYSHSLCCVCQGDRAYDVGTQQCHFSLALSLSFSLRLTLSPFVLLSFSDTFARTHVRTCRGQPSALTLFLMKLQIDTHTHILDTRKQYLSSHYLSSHSLSSHSLSKVSADYPRSCEATCHMSCEATCHMSDLDGDTARRQCRYCEATSLPRRNVP